MANKTNHLLFGVSLTHVIHVYIKTFSVRTKVNQTLRISPLLAVGAAIESLFSSSFFRSFSICISFAVSIWLQRNVDNVTKNGILFHDFLWRVTLQLTMSVCWFVRRFCEGRGGMRSNGQRLYTVLLLLYFVNYIFVLSTFYLHSWFLYYDS